MYAYRRRLRSAVYFGGRVLRLHGDGGHRVWLVLLLHHKLNLHGKLKGLVIIVTRALLDVRNRSARE